MKVLIMQLNSTSVMDIIAYGGAAVGMIDPRRQIIDQAMIKEVELLQQQIRKLKTENETLKKENLKLRKALNRKELSIVKNL